MATPLLVLLLTGVGWRIRARFERQIQLADKLRADRIQIYNAILEPFIVLLMTDAAWAADPKNRKRDKNQTARQTMLSLDYRQLGFRLSLMATDGVVRAYNDLMQYFYERDPDAEGSESELAEMLSLLGSFLLEIRRSSGNEHTELSAWEMLEWWMSDARRLAREYPR